MDGFDGKKLIPGFFFLSDHLLIVSYSNFSAKDHFIINLITINKIPSTIQALPFGFLDSPKTISKILDYCKRFVLHFK